MNKRGNVFRKRKTCQRREIKKRILSGVMCVLTILSLASGKAQAAGARLTLTATALGSLTMADGTPYKVLHASLYSQPGDSVEPGQIVYCVEPGVTLTILPEEAMGVPSVEGSPEGIYTMTSSTIPVKGVIRAMLGRILQVGGFSDPHTTVNTVLNSTDAACQAAAVQLLIWETVSGDLNAGFELVGTSIQNSRGFIGMSNWEKVKALHDQYLSQLKDAHKLPSFLSASSAYAKSYEQDSDTLVLVDENEVVSKPYMHLSVSDPSVTMNIEGNTLTLHNPEGVDFEITAENSLCDGSKMPIPLITTSPSGNEPRQMTICPSAASLSDPVKGFAAVKGAVPSIKTTAVDEATGTHTGAKMSETCKIIDTVSFTNLKVGKEYRLEGVLMNKETGEAFTDASGEVIIAEKRFIPEENTGSEEVSFEVDSNLLIGKTVVVFETLYEEQKELCVHADLEDEEQSVFYPRIQTTAEVSSTEGSYRQEKTVPQGEEEFILIDTVEYENLCSGSYVLKTKIVEKQSGESIYESAEEVVTGTVSEDETDFGQEGFAGSFTVQAKLSYEAVCGKALVVFEQLFQNGVLVASHEDPLSEEQTVYIPQLLTQALVPEAVTEKTVSVCDIVYFKGLEPGKTYQLEASLMERSDPSVCLKRQTVLLTPTEESGEESVSMELSAKELAGKRVVFYEVLRVIDEETGEATVLYRHEDPENENQQLFFPAIKTNAKDQASGGKRLTPSKDQPNAAVIEDVVSYSGLKEQATYQMKASLYDAVSGELLYEALSPILFTPEESGEGTVTVTLPIDLARLSLETDRKVTVFEELLSEDGTILAKHCSLADEAQSVIIPSRPPIGSKEVPKTGEENTGVFGELAAGIGILFLLVLLVILRKKEISTYR